MEKDITLRKKNRKSKIIKRLIIYIIIMMIFLSIGTILLKKSLNFTSEKIIKYNEKSNIDYKVYLIKNDFYEKEYLEKDMLYIASLIDNLQINFDYIFQNEDKEDIEFSYDIFGKILINSKSGTKSYFEKEYKLLTGKKVYMTNSNIQHIQEQITIDYPYYNNLANNFKKIYGVDADSKLIVYMTINKKNTANSDFILNDDSTMNIVIPLSDKSVDIKLDYKEINETSTLLKKAKMMIKDIVPLTIAIILIMFSLMILIKIIFNIKLLLKKKTAYDKYVSKILKEYDRLIAESSTLMSFENKEIIHIKKFTELLDIHDNLQLPIMYYEIEEHESCYFYINNKNIVYLMKIQSKDLNKKTL